MGTGVQATMGGWVVAVVEVARVGGGVVMVVVVGGEAVWWWWVVRC